MIRTLLQPLLALIAVALLMLPAHAQINILPEVRAGLFVRGVDGSDTLLDANRISDANVELLFNAPDLNAWVPLGELRPHLGATLNVRGDDSYGYAGLSWTVAAPLLPVFAEASLGGVARTSLVTAPQDDPARKFGCGFGLRAAVSVGLSLPAGTSLIGTLEHLPDFGACASGRANTNVGVRLGFRF